MKIHAILATLLLHLGLPALAQPDEAGKLIAAGTVPDEAARAAILGKLRELYGAANVVDRLEVGGVVVGDVPSFRADNMPYGGVKDSGLGREGEQRVFA